MSNSVRYVKAIGIHRRFDLEIELQTGVNILYGKNGTGKTTLLHILANILNGDFERFAFLPFETIEVHLDNNEKIRLRQYQHSEDSKIEAHRNTTPVAIFSVKEAKSRLINKSSGRAEIDVSPLRALQGLKPIIQTAYFPAFRTLIEASGNDNSFLYEYPSYHATLKRTSDRQTANSTIFARKFLGNFVPWINYPSPEDVSNRLSIEMQEVLNVVANTDRKLLSKAFLQIFATLSAESKESINQSEQILDEIKSLFSRLEESSIISDPSSDEEVYYQLRDLVRSFKVRTEAEEIYVPILEVYRNSLTERAGIQEESSKLIKTYLDSVNRFLEGKELVLRKISGSQIPILQVKFHKTDLYSQVQSLSSGERQIVTLIYSATHMSKQEVVLIDEPEISLHIDWQSLLIPEMVSQLQNRQIITCTHSPMIGDQYEEQMIELEAKPSSKRVDDKDDVVEEIEENL